MSNENMETPRGFSKKPLIIIAAAVVIAGGGAAAAVTAVNYSNSPARLITLAQKFLDDADYEKSIIEFDRVLTVDPLNVDAYVGKAEALEALGRTDEAIKVLEQALEAVRDSAGADELDRLQRLLDELNGAVVVVSTAEATDTAEAPETAEVEQPAQADGVYVLTSRYSGDSNGYISEFYDEDGNWRVEEYFDNGLGVEDTYITIKRVLLGDVNLSMCPVYFEYIDSSSDGTPYYYDISDYREPGVVSDHQYYTEEEIGEETRKSDIYATDENGWMILDRGTTYTYEFDSEGRPIRMQAEELNNRLNDNIENELFPREGITEFEYGENGRLNRKLYYDDDGLKSEERFDEWGNRTYYMHVESIDYMHRQSLWTETEEITYKYTFGENGCPVSAEISNNSTREEVKNGETKTTTSSGSYTETYTYEKLKDVQSAQTTESQPAQTALEFVLTSRYHGDTDDYTSEFYDEDGNWHVESYNNDGEGGEESDITIDRVFRGDVNLIMCPVYYEYRYSTDGTLNHNVIYDYREPGVESDYDYHYNPEDDENADESQEYYTYETDENGWIIAGSNTYEFDGEGRPMRKMGRKGVTEYEYGENGLLSHISEYHDDIGLVSEKRYDEWGNCTYIMNKSKNYERTTWKAYSYSYTFGENGAPISAEVSVISKRITDKDGEKDMRNGKGSYTETYTYEKVQ